MKTALELADLEKRNKELDAREAYIDAKQKELDDAPITIKVFEARKQTYERTLKELEDKIHDAEEKNRLKYKQTTRNFELQEQRNSLKLRNINVEIDDAKNVLSDLGLKEQGIRDTIKSLQQEVRQQQSYLTAQEKTVEQAIEQANNRLLELKDICGDLEDSIRSLKSEKVSLERSIDDSIVHQKDVESEHELSMAGLKSQENKLRLQLDDLVNRIASKGKEYKQVSSDIDKKMTQLIEKEESLLTKQRKVREEKRELDNEKRRFDSKKSLYEV